MKAILIFLCSLVLAGCSTIADDTLLYGSHREIEEVFCPDTGLLSVEEQTTYPRYVIVRCKDGQYMRYAYKNFNYFVSKGPLFSK